MEKPVRYLKGVGEKRAAQFEKLGVGTVAALLQLYPRRYIDYTAPYGVATAPYEQPCVVKATIFAKAAPVRTKGGSTMVRVTAGDESATLTITFFNNPYGANALEIGKEYLFYGKATGPLLRRDMVAPTFLPASGALPLVPVYPLTEGISSKVVAGCVKSALALVREELGHIPEVLPQNLLTKYRLLGKDAAVRALHLPKNMGEVEEARRRLIFEELLILQLGLLGLKGRERTPTAVQVKNVDLAPFFASLPFTPTGAQQNAIAQIVSDMAGPLPMNRLLQGDVGSGKTLVGAAAMFAAAKSGYQSALMAPTELLCAQHAETLQTMLAPFGITVALLTGSVKGAARKATTRAIANGSAQVVVGTHALISTGVEFMRLGLAITDEQHRFGVRQRGLFAQKGHAPHMLVMSATPIPRTLALLIFGDLDISVLNEMPKGRKPIKTYRITSDIRPRMFGFIAQHVQAGRQAYIVCPVIEEGKLEVSAVTTYYEEIAKPLLPTAKVGLLHGRLKAVEKAELMAAFYAGEIDVLCSTTVIEVGVDVPNATIMAIENAEHFGLSALHQLRGRVGRGAEESFCILISDAETDTATARLNALCKSQDGFELAKKDLEARGPGDFFGNRQHGLPTLHIADLATDTATLDAAREEAKALLEQNPTLAGDGLTELRNAVDTLFEGERKGTLN